MVWKDLDHSLHSATIHDRRFLFRRQRNFKFAYNWRKASFCLSQFEFNTNADSRSVSQRKVYCFVALSPLSFYRLICIEHFWFRVVWGIPEELKYINNKTSCMKIIVFWNQIEISFNRFVIFFIIENECHLSIYQIQYSHICNALDEIWIVVPRWMDNWLRLAFNQWECTFFGTFTYEWINNIETHRFINDIF